MQTYLPIAEMSVNVLLILGMGGAVGFLSGMFGVGGGFLLTPLLIFSGIPPAIAVATQVNQIVASSLSAALAHLRRQSVDVRLGLVLLLGGLIGSAVGVRLFQLLRQIGQLDLAVALLYVCFLGTIGSLMLIESVRALRRHARGESVSTRRPGQHNWIHRLPLKMRFKRSKLYVSVIPVLVLGAFIGVLTSIMGVGGGFIMVPALIYLLRVPTKIVIGTSLFQIVFVAAFTTLLHALTTFSVDIVLAMLLMVGGVVGAQFGVRVGYKLRGEQLRALLALLVLGVAVRLAAGLVATPDALYSLTPGELE